MFKLPEQLHSSVYDETPSHREIGLLRGKKNIKLQWNYCRDEALDSFNKKTDKHLFYYEKPDALKKTVRFLKKIEDVLKLHKKDRLQYLKTNNEKVICLRLSNWWRCKYKFSLLTMFLRIGYQYKGGRGNWKKVIAGSEVYNDGDDNKSVFRFLDGYTKFVKPRGWYFDGWVDFFRDYNYEHDYQKTRVLRKP